jgi:glutamate carboxypeptidase
VQGRGAHAGSSHHQGANAIVQLGRVVDRIAALTDYSRDLTVTVGKISGGTVLNRVPHEAVADGELRAFKPEVFEQAKAALLALNGPGDVQAKIDRFACQVKVEILGESRPWPRNPGTDRLFQIWQSAGAVAGYPLGEQERGGLSDGNLIWNAVPTLDGLGPWGDNSHCSERSADGSKLPEYVEISSFVPKAVANVLAIENLVAS